MRADPPPPGTRRGLALVAGGLLALVAAAALGGLAYRRFAPRPPREVRLATGGRGGTYLPLGTAIADVLSSEIPGVAARAIETEGSRDNMRRLAANEVELALVQNDTPGGSNVRAIAALYQEVLQVVVRDPAIEDPVDLRRKRVAVGPAGGGTEGVAKVVFAHFGLAEGDLDVRRLTLAEAIPAFEKGEIDAVFALAGPKAPAIDRLLAVRGAHLLSLGDPSRAGSSLEGLRIDAPFLSPAVIPQRTYGAHPAEPVGTLGVWALLVARSDLPDDLVREVTRAIFDSKVRLAERERVVGRLSERFDPGEIRFPVHPGATLYYHRDDPPLIQTWADTISLGITLALLVGSGALTVREAVRRSKKNRIDVYYIEIQQLTAGLDDATPLDRLTTMKEGLQELRKRAFHELVAERLEANESFTIFQDYLRSELLEVEAAIRNQQRAMSNEQ